MTGGAASTTHTCDFTIFINSADSTTATVAITTNAAGVGSFSITNAIGGWWGLNEIFVPPSVSGGVPSALQLTYGPSNTSDPFNALLPAFPVYESNNSTIIYSGTRVNASGLLVSNTTPLNWRGGRIIASRLPTNFLNVWNPVTLTQATQAAPKSKAYEGDATKGVYTWTVPDESDMRLADYNTTYNGFSGATLACNLADFAFVNAVTYLGGVISQSGTSNTTVQTFCVEFDYTVEYVHNSQLIVSKVTPHFTQDYEAALKAIGGPPPFTENPLHIKALAALVHSLLSEAWPLFRPAVKQGMNRLNQRLQSYL